MPPVARKIALPVVSIPTKRPQPLMDDNEKEAVQPAKKHKGPTGRPRGRPPKNKVGMSDAAKELLNIDNAAISRSGRPRVPSMKMRENEPPLRTRVSPRKTSSSNPFSSPLSAPSTSPETVRHHTPNPLEASPADSPQKTKIITPKSLAVAAQPRDSNGRFGKKAETNGRFMRSKHFSVGSKRLCKGPKTSFLTKRTAEPYDDATEKDDKVEQEESNDNDTHQYNEVSPDLTLTNPVEFGEEALEDVVNRRSNDPDHSEDPYGKRKRSLSDDDDSDSLTTASSRFIMGRARGSLLRPNPISFARRKWAACEDDDISISSSIVTKNYVIDDTEETAALEEDNSVFEEAPDYVSAISAVPESGSDAETSLRDDSDESTIASPPTRSLVPTARLARLTFRPSPMNLAKRRWAPVVQKSRLSESSIDVETSGRSVSLVPQAARLTLVGTELDDDFPFGHLGYPSESDGYVTEEVRCFF
jgi:[histone H4]-N-methyl-L-lysine20 N-methyltransferase